MLNREDWMMIREMRKSLQPALPTLFPGTRYHASTGRGRNQGIGEKGQS